MLKNSNFLMLAIISFLAAAAIVPGARCEAAEQRPSIVVITVDALRADRLGCYGYERSTSPNIDRLVARGVRFERAWTPEPLTGPAMCSMVTGLLPHQHAASRNGLRMKAGLDSFPLALAEQGWNTAAFVGTWTLKDKLTRLGEHFDDYGERLKRKRWFGVLNSEATAEDVTDDALDWVKNINKTDPDSPFLLWTHYIEPHAPYRFHDEYAERLDVNNDKLTKSDRYDTEIAAVDESIGLLLDGIRRYVHERDLIVVFTADHGESLGEHHYWGHGRYLYEPSLRVPLAIVWEGRIEAGSVTEQANLIDLAPTLLGLAGLEAPDDLPGLDWSDSILANAPVSEQARCFQAHKGAVHGGRDSERARSKGLLWVGVIDGDHKEIFKPGRQILQIYDLGADPGELETLATVETRPSEELIACLAEVSDGLGSLDRLATQKLDDETIEQLKALGYLE